MAKKKISTEDQLNRLSQLQEEITKIETLEIKTLIKKPNQKSWSVLEVIEHITISYDAYRIKLDKSIAASPNNSNDKKEFTASLIPSLLFNSFRPKNGAIKSKMKTFKKFKPAIETNSTKPASENRIFSNFYGTLKHLESVINYYAVKDVTNHKFNSAIGVVVRFNIVEAVEFIICHNERHLQQIKDTLKKVG